MAILIKNYKYKGFTVDNAYVALENIRQTKQTIETASGEVNKKFANICQISIYSDTDKDNLLEAKEVFCTTDEILQLDDIWNEIKSKFHGYIVEDVLE